MTIKVQVKTIKEGRIREKLLLIGSNNREMEVRIIIFECLIEFVYNYYRC